MELAENNSDRSYFPPIYAIISRTALIEQLLKTLLKTLLNNPFIFLVSSFFLEIF